MAVLLIAIVSVGCLGNHGNNPVFLQDDERGVTMVGAVTLNNSDFRNDSSRLILWDMNDNIIEWRTNVLVEYVDGRWMPMIEPFNFTQSTVRNADINVGYLVFYYCEYKVWISVPRVLEGTATIGFELDEEGFHIFLITGNRRTTKAAGVWLDE